MKLSCAAAAALVTCSTYAQVVVPPSADPGALQQRRIEEDQRRLEQERLERTPAVAPVIEAPKAPATAPVASQVRFKVNAVKFSPASEVLSAEELKALADAFVGKEVSFADLQRLAEQVNAAYRERGVVTARAIIPPQDVSSGNITLQLVEGKLGEIRVKGNESTRASYVLSRVDAEPGRLVDLPTLQTSLLRFNRTNAAQLRAELKPGQSFGSTDLEIGIIEPKQHNFRIGVDNLGSEVTGETRLGVSYANQSLFGWRDTLNLAAMSASRPSCGRGLRVRSSWGHAQRLCRTSLQDLRPSLAALHAGRGCLSRGCGRQGQRHLQTPALCRGPPGGKRGEIGEGAGREAKWTPAQGRGL